MFSQLSKPETGEPIARMKTNMGDIVIRLFESQAPKTVENFVTHAQDGYYDGLIFHRVIKDFMIQGGDPTGTGRGGESIWGRSFKDEFDMNLHNLRGALSMANAGPNTNGSQFFIVTASAVPADMLKQMVGLRDSGFPQETIDAYKKLGGTPWLDYKHSVFGQVIEGMDVADAISAVRCGPDDKPKKDVVIETIEITYAE